MIRQAGAILVRHEFGRVEELAALPEAVVVNCTGMGSALLCSALLPLGEG